MAWRELAHEAKFTFEILGTSHETFVVDFSSNERISSPFEVSVSLACEDEITFADVVGKESLLTIFGDEEDRLLHGIVNTFMHTGTRDRFHYYHASVVPSLWLLTLEQDCRIFQNKSVQDIVKKILQEGGITGDKFAFRLQNSYKPREYCVQYRETDLNFISRLLQEEGIFYFFEHEKGKHVVVFADSAVAYKPIAGAAKVKFNPSVGLVPEEECVYDLSFTRRIHTGKFTQRDFNFEKPSLDLTTFDQADEYQKLERYDFPGEYQDQGRGKKLAKVRLQEAVTFKEVADGRSYCPRFIPGFTFTLAEHERGDLNQEYLLVEVLTNGSQPAALPEHIPAGTGMTYSNAFHSIPSTVTFRPERSAVKPIVEGVQTAIVVGPKGEEIYPDEHGRVKVQFHWDREGKMDEKSSCWIRVSQVWAGAGWGAMYIPRIGQEVIVDFIEGDPDRPIITGRVYHGENKPPYSLPDEKTKSTIMSDSSLGGDGSNEFRFEDKKGEEEIYLHGQKDWTIVIENDKNQSVGHDETLSVGNDRTKTVGKNQSESIGENKSISVGKNHDESIGASATISVGENESVSIGKDMSENVGENKTITVGSNLSESIGKSTEINTGKNYTLAIGENCDIMIGKKTDIQSGDDLTITCGKKAVLEVENQFTIKCGKASIVMKKNGDIQIKGNKINIKGSGDVKVKGSKIGKN